MADKRIGIVAVVVIAAVVAAICLFSGAYRTACPDSVCGADGDRAAPASGGGGDPTSGGGAPGSPGSSGAPGAPAAPAVPARPRDRLRPGERLARGETLTSPDGRITLTLQEDDGNLVIYEDRGSPLWRSGPIRDAAWLVNQRDGNLVLVRDNGSPAWASGTAGKGEATLYLLDDGNLVLLGPGERMHWETDTGSNR